MPLAAAAVIVATCWPVLRSPQLDSDDYRYLLRVEDLRQDFLGHFVGASIVENRWDHLWWMAIPEKVRFFRPTVVLSYGVDSLLYGRHVVAGLFVTNLLIYWTCCVLVGALLARWVGVGLPAIVGVVFFAAHASHSELVWYVAGRTDSLAAVGFLGALLAHVHRARGPWIRVVAVAAYAIAFLSKELTIALPVACLLHERLVERRMWRQALRGEWRQYAAYALAAVAVQAWRTWALAGEPSAVVFPYLVSPTRADFPRFLWIELRNYAENLLIGTISPPLLSMDRIAAFVSPAGLWLSLLAGATAVWLCALDRRAVLALCVGVLAWAPASFVYLCERYLLIPSAMLAAMVALLLARAARWKAAFAGATALALAWSAYHGHLLYTKNAAVAAPRPMSLVNQRVAAASGAIPRGASLFVLNCPGDWLNAQFLEDQLRWVLRDPTLRVRVLTTRGLQFSAPPRHVTLRVVGPNEFELLGDRRGVVDRVDNAFELSAMTPGSIWRSPSLGFQVQVISGAGGRCDAARVRTERPLSEYLLLDLSRENPVVGWE